MIDRPNVCMYDIDEPSPYTRSMPSINGASSEADLAPTPDTRTNIDIKVTVT